MIGVDSGVDLNTFLYVKNVVWFVQEVMCSIPAVVVFSFTSMLDHGVALVPASTVIIQFLFGGSETVKYEF